jgi:hypothetical protein
VLSTPNRAIRLRCGVPLAAQRLADYHRFSMIATTANVKAFPPAAIAAFAIIAPPAR